MYKIVFSKRAVKDIELLKQQPALLRKAKSLVEVLKNDPFQTPPTFEKLVGDLEGLFSRRINVQHRLVYKIEGDVVYIVRMWTHYQ
ncbi:MAG: Txe/YoeB family addiction module toxin [Acholeplasmataceae bacterium]|nr:Txe/YoeB family addiction module toxin [Acholeplasmataceae bacterium]MDD2575376.1 Txe/YoeB family addiction module toxin [Acholeplasmataceae bacterium]